MTTIIDNPKLNEAIQNLANAINNTNAAIENIDVDFDKLDELESIEAKAEDKLFDIIFAMMPKKIAQQMQQHKYIAGFKARTIDKYILNA